MVKISGLPQQSAPTPSDKVPVVSGGQTNYELISDLITLFFNNIPVGSNSPITRGSENIFDYVQGGSGVGGTATGVWTADSAGVNRNASMTAATIYLNGRRITISAVTARTFTASKDTYIDVLDNQDGTGTLVYTEVANNAASPALAANSIRIGIIVTGATTIAAAGSVNQGQETKLLPIVSSVPYQVTDSLGNLICPRDPQRKILGTRVATASYAASTSVGQFTGLSCPVIVPAGRKIKVSAYCDSATNGATTTCQLSIWDGTVGSGTQIARGTSSTTNNQQGTMAPSTPVTPTSASKTYNVGAITGSGTATFNSGATLPSMIMIELV